MYCMQCGALLPHVPEEETQLHCAACGYTSYRNPSPCVSILIVSKGKVLLGLRGGTSIMPGKWCLPCGHVEGDETFLTAAQREVREETGLEIAPLSIVNVVTNHFPGNVHSLVVVLVAAPLTNRLLAGDDLVEAAWFPIDGPFPDMAFQADLHIIGQYRRFGKELGIPLECTQIEFFEDGIGKSALG